METTGGQLGRGEVNSAERKQGRREGGKEGEREREGERGKG